MSETKNKNKIYTVFVLCLGIVVSVWLLNKNTAVTTGITTVTTKADSISADSYKTTESNTNDEWKKILVSVDAKNQDAITNLTLSNSSLPEETTLTAQMSRDFMSQYLLLKKGGKTLTTEDTQAITDNILASPQYLQTAGTVYIPNNLHVIKNDVTTLRKYRDSVNLILKTRSMQVKENPVMIINATVQSGKESTLLGLDEIILVGKRFVSDLLNVEVPISAVDVHLALLNSLNKTVSDLESIREMFTDPIKSLAGISQYNADLAEFQKALNNMNLYFNQIN